MVAGPPPGLLRFQRTLVPPPGVAGRDLLTAADPYINQDREHPLEVISGVPVREVAGWRVSADIHLPAGRPPFPVLLYLHGGAWVLGAPSSHRRLAQDLAALGLLTIVLDYRRAPKHRFPAAVDDTIHAVSWVRQRAADFGGDPDRLVIGGDSAGANLAAAALAAGASGVAGALFCYGIFDVHRALPALAALVGGPDPDSQGYLEPDDHRRLLDDPRLHPERHCEGFPPSLVMVGDQDPLLAESLMLSERLAEASVPHRTIIVPDAPHGFLQMPTEPMCQVGLRAVGDFLTHNRIT